MSMVRERVDDQPHCDLCGQAVPPSGLHACKAAAPAPAEPKPSTPLERIEHQLDRIATALEQANKDRRNR